MFTWHVDYDFDTHPRLLVLFRLWTMYNKAGDCIIDV